MIYQIVEFALFLLVLFFIVPGVVLSSTRLVRSVIYQSRRDALRYKALSEKLLAGS
jgi:hypothetical protein